MKYAQLKNKPTDKFGKCPICKNNQLKIIFGWDGVYYNLVCENNHNSTYSFRTKKIKAD